MADSVRDTTVFKGQRVDMVLRSVTTRSGRQIQREVVVHPGAVIILPVLADGQLVFIRNFRHTVGEELFELPAGTLDHPESPLECARRELLEETGYAAQQIRPFGWFYTSPGILTEKMYAFVATGLTAGPQHLEDNEEITLCPLSPQQVWSMVGENKIADGKTLAVVLKYMVAEGLTGEGLRG